MILPTDNGDVSSPVTNETSYLQRLYHKEQGKTSPIFYINGFQYRVEITGPNPGTSIFKHQSLKYMVRKEEILPSSTHFQLSEVEAELVFIVAISTHQPNHPGKYQNGLGQLVLGKESCQSISVHTKNDFDSTY